MLSVLAGCLRFFVSVLRAFKTARRVPLRRFNNLVGNSGTDLGTSFAGQWIWLSILTRCKIEAQLQTVAVARATSAKRPDECDVHDAHKCGVKSVKCCGSKFNIRCVP
jgi:hypothetical protein